MQGIDIKTVALDVIGFCLKAEAGNIKGDVIMVSKGLWLEIADRLQKEKSVDLEKIMERLDMQKWDGASNIDIAHNGALDVAKDIVRTEILGLKGEMHIGVTGGSR